LWEPELLLRACLLLASPQILAQCLCQPLLSRRALAALSSSAMEIVVHPPMQREGIDPVKR
jgi:hypothetical protein